MGKTVHRDGKASPDIIQYLKDFLKKNTLKYKIEMAFLYGSRTGGLPKSDSDIDLAVVFSDNLTDDKIFIYLTDISFLLSRIFTREVDVISIYSDFRHPMLYFNAIVYGIPVFVKDFSEYAELKNEALFQMEDFNLFCRDWQLRIAKRNMEALHHA